MGAKALPIILRDRTPLEDPESEPDEEAVEDDDTPQPGVGDVLATASGLDESEDPEAGDVDVRPPEADLPVDAPAESAEDDLEVD